MPPFVQRAASLAILLALLRVQGAWGQEFVRDECPVMTQVVHQGNRYTSCLPVESLRLMMAPGGAQQIGSQTVQSSSSPGWASRLLVTRRIDNLSPVFRWASMMDQIDADASRLDEVTIVLSGPGYLGGPALSTTVLTLTRVRVAKYEARFEASGAGERLALEYEPLEMTYTETGSTGRMITAPPFVLFAPLETSSTGAIWQVPMTDSGFEVEAFDWRPVAARSTGFVKIDAVEGGYQADGDRGPKEYIGWSRVTSFDVDQDCSPMSCTYRFLVRKAVDRATPVHLSIVEGKGRIGVLNIIMSVQNNLDPGVSQRVIQYTVLDPAVTQIGVTGDHLRAWQSRMPEEPGPQELIQVQGGHVSIQYWDYDDSGQQIGAGSN